MATTGTLKTGHTFEPLDEEDFKRISKDFPTYDNLIRINPGGWIGYSTGPYIFDRIYDFDFKPSDIIVMTYPKSGTTWMQETVWNLVHNANLDNPDANTCADIRSPHIELDTIINNSKMPKISDDTEMKMLLKEVAPHRANDPSMVIPFLEEVTKSPRVIKTHLPIPLFPPKMLETSKLIYLARDPRDVIVSKFNFYRNILAFNYQGDLDSFIDYMINEEQINHPFWPHVKVALDLKDHRNLLFLHFEDLKADPIKTITRISEFLNLNRTPEQIQNVVTHTNFTAMKERIDKGVQEEPMSDGGRLYKKDTPGFFRKGKSGNWKESFTAEQVDKINKWMDKNMEMFPADFKYNDKK